MDYHVIKSNLLIPWHYEPQWWMHSSIQPLERQQGERCGRAEPTHSRGWVTLHAGPPAEQWSPVSSLVPPQDADCGRSQKLVAASSPAQQLPCPTCAALNWSKSRQDKYLIAKSFDRSFFFFFTYIKGFLLCCWPRAAGSPACAGSAGCWGGRSPGGACRCSACAAPPSVCCSPSAT